MPGVKGKTNNMNGRPKGAVNPIIASLREEIRLGIKTNHIINRMFMRLELIEDDYKYVQTAMNILEMVMPKLAAEVSDAELDTKKDVAAVMEMIWNKIQGKTG
jgi:hypothetical protein